MWTYENLFPDLMMWLLVAACSFWAMVQLYETFFRFQTRARANRAVINALQGRTELRLHVPSHIAHAARGRGLRIQLALVDREFNNLELHPSAATPSMTEEEINAMPIHKYNVNNPVSASSSAQVSSSSLASREFHANCIEPWLKKHAICPVCKALMCSKKQAIKESGATASVSASAAASAAVAGGGGDMV